MRGLHEGTQPPRVFPGPFARMSLAAFLDHAPRVVPPPAVVRGRSRRKLFWRAMGGPAVCPNGSKRAQPPARGDDIVEVALLAVRLARQDQQGPGFERHDPARIGPALRRCEPSFVLAH